METYKERIKSYPFSVIEVRDVSIDVATDIFTRINVGGKSLTVFEIMSAKTYNEKPEFDLTQEYSKLVEELGKSGYETISNQSILQLIALILKNDCKRKTILELNKNDFIEIWPQAVDSVKDAVGHFRDVMRIPVSKLLPYTALIVPFAYFFYQTKSKPPTSEQQKMLHDFFWRSSLVGRYSSAVESKLAQDIGRIKKILNNQLPDYDWGINITPEFIIRNGLFNVGRSFIKALLCIMAYKDPISFSVKI